MWSLPFRRCIQTWWWSSWTRNAWNSCGDLINDRCFSSFTTRWPWLKMTGVECGFFGEFCMCVSVCNMIFLNMFQVCLLSFKKSERLWFDEGIMSSRMCVPMCLGWLIWDWYRARCKWFDRLNWKWVCLWSKFHYLSMVCQIMIWRTKIVVNQYVMSVWWTIESIWKRETESS